MAFFLSLLERQSPSLPRLLSDVHPFFPSHDRDSGGRVPDTTEVVLKRGLQLLYLREVSIGGENE